MEIKRQGLENNFVLIFTGQHEDLTKDLFERFEIKPNYTIHIKNSYSKLSYAFSDILSGIQKIIENIRRTDKISMIIGQGDTTSCVCAAMCSFFNGIPFGHIEAGLRTNDFKNPYPEEYFRRIITLTSTINFAPTIRAKENLLKEGIRKENIILTGNTIVDAIEIIRTHIPKPETKNNHCKNFINSKNNILITCHRRENQNNKFYTLVETIKLLANENPSLNFIWISHKTPFIKNELTSETFLDQNNIFVISPINVIEIYNLYNNTRIIITDSGGVQEEAPSFNIPVIIIREHTERTESIDLGYSKLSSNLKEDLICSFNNLIKLRPMKMENPYGDGKASQRIVNYLNKIA